jgi:predicted transcriptional regulator
MIEDRDAPSEKALADIAFLGRSRNRVEILEVIVSQPHSPREIAEATGSARSTLERILAELEDRGWAERTPEGEYVGTDAGKFVVDEFTPLVRAMEAIRILGDEISWLPRDELTINLSHFHDAIVRRPEEGDPTEAIDYMTELMRETVDFRVISNLRPPEPIAKVLHERVAAGQLTVDYVITEDVIEYLSGHAERRERWVDTTEAGATLWRWEGAIPCNLWIFDDTVWIKKSGPESIQETYGVPIISDDSTVRSWGDDLIDRYRNDATRVDVETFAEKPTAPRADSDTVSEQ